MALRRQPYLDVKEHLRIWRRQILPLFTFLAAMLMVVFVILRASEQGQVSENFVPARNGLLAADGNAPFDPALAVLSPVELTLAPEAPVFLDSPRPAAISADPDAVIAVADGKVTFAGLDGGKNTVILLHRRGSERIETIYHGLATLRVPVGAQVRRGQVLGTLAPGSEGAFRFTRRQALHLDPGLTAGDPQEIPAEWRGREADRLSPPPAGATLAPSVQIDAPAEAP